MTRVDRGRLAVAANRAVEIGDVLKVSIVDPPGTGAYPIASFTWLVVPAHIADGTERNAIAGFLRWMLGPGKDRPPRLGIRHFRRT
jgi:phosphate transport system substrate-binding protein